MTDDKFKAMLDFYYKDADFKRYVDAEMSSYGKVLGRVLCSPITYEYYLSLQKGGCNARNK